MAAASVPSVSSAAIVVSAAKPVIQSRDTADRIPFEISRNRRGAVAEDTLLCVGRPRRARWPSHQAGQRDRDGKGDAIGQAEDRTQSRGCGNAADRGGKRPPSERRHYQRQRRQIKQQ